MIHQTAENEITIKPDSHYDDVVLESSYDKRLNRWELLPAGQSWQHFWDVWERHKEALTDAGIYVRKKSGAWGIYIRPMGWTGIELLKRPGFKSLGDWGKA